MSNGGEEEEGQEEGEGRGVGEEAGGKEVRHREEEAPQPAPLVGWFVMPSKSKAQAKLMKAAAHSKKFAKKAGVPQKVAKHYVAADKGRPSLKK